MNKDNLIHQDNRNRPLILLGGGGGGGYMVFSIYDRTRGGGGPRGGGGTRGGGGHGKINCQNILKKCIKYINVIEIHLLYY